MFRQTLRPWCNLSVPHGIKGQVNQLYTNLDIYRDEKLGGVGLKLGLKTNALIFPLGISDF
jgi:hypothetical protein